MGRAGSQFMDGRWDVVGCIQRREAAEEAEEEEEEQRGGNRGEGEGVGRPGAKGDRPHRAWHEAPLRQVARPQLVLGTGNQPPLCH